MDLWSKIQITMARVYEWYREFDGKVYISFSGGKDSTVLLDITRRFVEPLFKIEPNSIPAVFIDTGLEYPEIREFVKTKENVISLKPEMSFKKVIDTYGYPLISKEVSRDVAVVKRNPNCKTASRFDPNSEHILKYGKQFSKEKYKYLITAPFDVSNKCCDIMKKHPAKQYEKATGMHPIIGTMADESQQRKSNWLLHGCNAFSAARPTSQPMSFWTEQDVLEYIRTYEVPYASVYGDIVEDKNGKLKTTLCSRTGCVFCGFGCQCEKDPNRFQRLKITHPKLWEYCMKSKEQGGLGMKEVLNYINVKSE